ncbi:type IX secretion system outer membrane channel protein PorV [Stygiobacter electus]|uniref:Type IX secretion system outer membrane channel protein PorV n=1 Tax=Stygiobacter electus TaxID=3032292 RepID=A0AAE3NXF5_9BACT|nr:type IX secretion system outer membrane channel protein PorV [Stygiobacter electus]MDF1611841.1 type IX secretion system outer membrane channel protein PorV [Stygiobacter electus]
MKRMSMLMIIIAMFVSANLIKAQGEAAVPFLLLAPDSRAGGIGESGVALADNSAAIFWNPAGIAFQTGSEVSLTHSNWLPQFNLDLFYEYATYREYMEELNGSVTASITFMNFGEFVRTLSNSPDPVGTFRSFDAALTFGYATKLSNNWGLGFNFRIIHSRLADKPTEQEQGKGVATSVSFDVGALWRPEKFEIPLIGDLSNRFSFGLNLANLGPKIYYIDQAQADPIPTNLRFGFAVRPFEDEYNSLTWTLDFQKLLVGKADSSGKRPEFYKAIFSAWADEPLNKEIRDIVTSMGLEYWYGQPQDFMFAIRTGIFYEDPSYGNRKFVTLGAGIRYDMYGFDFSYITTDVFKGSENHPLSNTLRFTLLIGWGATPQKQLGFPRGI